VGTLPIPSGRDIQNVMFSIDSDAAAATAEIFAMRRSSVFGLITNQKVMALEQEHHGSKVILDVIEIDFLKSDEKVR
jgi:hypothetical protein